MNVIRNTFLVLTFILAFQGCKIADLRTSSIDVSLPNREVKALQLLDHVISKYNLNQLAQAETYSLQAVDNWRGLYALVNPFPKDNKLMELRFRPGLFDGQFNYVETENPKTYGVQSLKHYRSTRDGEMVFKKKKSIEFALPAIQYFFELPLRLQNAPILKYAGTQEFEGNTYELVFATWDRLEPHKEHDQYLLYFHGKTGDLTFASYTVRGIYLPSPKNTYGSIRFAEWRQNDDGIRYPGKLFIQLNKLKKPKRSLHILSLDNLQLNSFELSKLYPNDTLTYMGDSKF